MDKREFEFRIDKIKKLVAQGDNASAMKIADSIDWRRVRSTSLLTMASRIYEKNGEFTDAKDILLLAYERAPIGKGILYKLTDLALREGNVQEAEAYYREYSELADDDDPNQPLLRYMVLEARNAPIDQQINALEEYCRLDLDEKWLYRLAELYKEAGREEECVAACDKIMLMFGIGKYVDRAMRLKLEFAPLNRYQMDLVENREQYEERLRQIQERYREEEGESEGEVYDEESPDTPAEEEIPAAEEIPAEEEIPAAEEIPAEPEAPAAEEVPAEAEIPAEPEEPAAPAEVIPAEEEIPAAEETPAEEEIPEEPEEPAAPEAPAEEEISVTEEVPAEEEIPSAEEAPAAEEIPAEEIPAGEEIPAEPEVPAAEEIPAAEEVPAEEEKTILSGGADSEIPEKSTLEEDLAVSLHEARAEEELAREIAQIEPFTRTEETPEIQTRVYQKVRKDAGEAAAAVTAAAAAAVAAAVPEAEEEKEPVKEPVKAPEAAPETAAEEMILEDLDEEEEKVRTAIMVSREEGEDGIQKAKEALHTIHEKTGSRNQAAKISGQKLNVKGFAQILGQLKGRDLVIDQAAEMDDTAAADLIDILAAGGTEFCILLMDSKKNLAALEGRYPDLAKFVDPEGAFVPGEEESISEEEERAIAEKERLIREERLEAEKEAAAAAAAAAEMEAEKARKQAEAEAREAAEKKRREEYEKDGAG